MNKVLIVSGANGQLASEYQLTDPIEGWDYVFLDRTKFNIANQKQVKEIVSSADAIMNLAAYTNVEKAEKEETELAFNANSIGPKILAIECKKKEIPLIHISTDYVFDGEFDGAYTEEHTENPINQYGATKYLGEKWIQENHDWYYIIRTSWVYSNNSKNFFTTMLNLAQERTDLSVVNDQFGSPTSTRELSRALDRVVMKMDKNLSGVYHFTGLGKTSWKDFAEEIFKQCRIHIELKGVSSDAWPSKLKRPKNSYMSSDKFSKTFGYSPMHWKNALKEIVAERKILPVKVGDSVVTPSGEMIVVSTDWLKKIARVAFPLDMNRTLEVPFELLNKFERE